MKPYILAALIATTTPAAANVVSFDFTGPFGTGTINGRAVLDVQGGLATSGAITVAGTGIDGTQRLALVTPAGSVYRSANGTDLFGADNAWPITSDGLVFGTNAPANWTGGYNLGIWQEAGGYRGFASGPGLWSYTGQLTVTSGAVPEPATWAMCTAGFLALALITRRRRSPRTLFEASN